MGVRSPKMLLPAVASLVLLSSLPSSYCQFDPFNFQARYQNIYKNPEPPSTENWEKIWAGVHKYDGEIPKREARIHYPFGVTVRPNETVDSGLLTSRPQMSWPIDDDNALYTVLIVDNGIEQLLPNQFIHWLVTNIPGNSISQGQEMVEYVTPFSFDLEGDFFEFGQDPAPIDLTAPGHPMLAMVYKQSGEISVDETRRGCSEDDFFQVTNND